MYADKYVSDLKDIPTELHWAIIEIVSVYTPADERSKSCPGHGYPESTDNYIKYEVYFTQEKWEEAIKYRENKTTYGKKDYRAIKVYPAKISATVLMKVEQ